MSPILERSHTIILLSAEEDANIPTLKGDHSTLSTSSAWFMNSCSFYEVFLIFQNPMLLSNKETEIFITYFKFIKLVPADPVKNKSSFKGLKSIEYISPLLIKIKFICFMIIIFYFKFFCRKIQKVVIYLYVLIFNE